MVAKAGCRVCGLSPAAHHDFEDWAMPEGCVCAPQTWIVVKPTCPKFKGGITHHALDETYCIDCEHDRRCHPGERGAERE